MHLQIIKFSAKVGEEFPFSHKGIKYVRCIQNFILLHEDANKVLIFLQSYDQKRCKILNFLRWIKYWAKVYIKIMPKHQHNHIKSRLSLRARVKICSGCQKLHKNFGYTEYFTAQTCRSFLGGMGKCGTSETERANFYGTKNTWIVM